MGTLVYNIQIYTSRLSRWDIFRVKYGCCKLEFLYTFFESTNIIDYCYALGFSWKLGVLTLAFSQTLRESPHFYSPQGTLNSTPSRVPFCGFDGLELDGLRLRVFSLFGAVISRCFSF